MRSTVLINRFDLVARSHARTVQFKMYNRVTSKTKKLSSSSMYNTKLCAVGARKLPLFVHKPMSNDVPLKVYIYFKSHCVRVA